MPLLTATSAFGLRFDTIGLRDAILTCARKPTRVSLIYRTRRLGRRRQSSPQQCYLHCLCAVWDKIINKAYTVYSQSVVEVAKENDVEA